MAKEEDEMTDAEWIAYRQDKVDAHIASGKEFKPNPNCTTCDVHNDYVCFYCELFILGE